MEKSQEIERAVSGGINGWEAGTRTPIGRSRIFSSPKRLNKINHLARQNTDNSGKIRNTAARKNRRARAASTSRMIRSLERETASHQSMVEGVRS
jgi:hypothetical protein